MEERYKERISFAIKTKDLDWSRVVLTGTHKIGKIFIWGAVNEDGPCGVRLFNREMSPRDYVSILEGILLPMWDRNNQLVLMQNPMNYDPRNLVNKWFAEHPQIKFFNWPPASWDFDPIGYVWSQLRRNLEYDLPTNDKSIILEGWRDLKDDSGYYYDMLSSQARVIKEKINNESSGTL